ncbi:hypothetical protein RI543_002639 [Arxiozyma heterogenica]|uniref:Uncharacterized protein n=1 Tax=Arxiozyma heterogenica TaxID=278026 RepID=A0AAN7WQU6_9SACH|nr:hypothetical protein RI543_002639 [Kazachstania heterogenica]
MSGIYLTDRPVRRPPATGNTLLRKIQRACRMSLLEPDLALNLDIADYINEKQGGTSYDACNAIVKLINNRDTHTAVFALALLDVLVKNCGYPIHLQISRKEFLNQLVRRFPENPPLRYSKVQKLILTAIEEWYQTICKHATYKDDLNYIRDMRRLLKYKGYIFPRIHAEDLAVMRPTDQLKTASEIQKEQEIAQAAKLEELIRSGRPEDLKEANKLMKIMAGFKEDNLIHAKQAINNELNKLRRKADLLNEMLNTSNNDADLTNNETIEELYGSLKAAQPKFQKIIEEEHEDDNLVQDLLKFNDVVNQLLEKYSLIKAGNKTAASNINPESISTENNFKTTGGALANEINLIDFDNTDNDNDNTAVDNIASAPFTNTMQISTSSSNDPLVDLLGDLSLSNDKSSNQDSFLNVGEISLGSEPNLFNSNSINNSINNTTSTTNTLDLLGDFSTPTIQPTSPTSERILVNTDSNIKIELEIRRESDSVINLKIFFSNLSFSQITGVTFALAVPKSMQLKLQPQSSSILSANIKDGITQEAWIENALINSAKPLKLKWKVTYSINGVSPVENTSILTLPKI